MGSAIRNTHRRSRSRIALVACVCLALVSSACAHNIEVRTVAAPDAKFTGRSTFRLLPPAAYRGSVALGPNDPMLVNSITYRAIRDAIRREFELRGYRYSPTGADLDVAYYATAQPKLDIRTFDYGYDWRGFPREYTEVDQYEEGTVIIDVIDPATHRLLWRGQGSARVSTDPNKFIRELNRTVAAIIARFPRAMP